MSGDARIGAELIAELEAAEVQAWDALSRYKFWMFGYWAAIWVHLNRIGRFKRKNPWVELVKAARRHRSTAPAEAAAPLFEDAA